MKKLISILLVFLAAHSFGQTITDSAVFNVPATFNATDTTGHAYTSFWLQHDSLMGRKGASTPDFIGRIGGTGTGHTYTNKLPVTLTDSTFGVDTTNALTGLLTKGLAASLYRTLLNHDTLFMSTVYPRLKDTSASVGSNLVTHNQLNNLPFSNLFFNNLGPGVPVKYGIDTAHVGFSTLVQEGAVYIYYDPTDSSIHIGVNPTAFVTSSYTLVPGYGMLPMGVMSGTSMVLGPDSSKFVPFTDTSKNNGIATKSFLSANYQPRSSTTLLAITHNGNSTDTTIIAKDFRTTDSAMFKVNQWGATIAPTSPGAPVNIAGYSGSINMNNNFHIAPGAIGLLIDSILRLQNAAGYTWMHPLNSGTIKLNIRGGDGDTLIPKAEIQALIAAATTGGIPTGTPTVTAGTGAGTSPTITLDANASNSAGTITIVTGSSPTASGIIATLNFSTTLASAPHVVFSASGLAAGQGIAKFYSTGPTGSKVDFTNASAALTASQTYIITYIVAK